MAVICPYHNCGANFPDDDLNGFLNHYEAAHYEDTKSGSMNTPNTHHLLLFHRVIHQFDR